LAKDRDGLAFRLEQRLLPDSDILASSIMWEGDHVARTADQVATLDHPDLVVETLDEAKRDLVLWLTVGGDPIPMTIDHLGELLIGPLLR
jgi:hypothetical protein